MHRVISQSELTIYEMFELKTIRSQITAVHHCI